MPSRQIQAPATGLGGLPADQTAVARPEARVIVEARDAWWGVWIPSPNLVALRAEIHAGSAGYSTAEIEHLYGTLFEAGEAPTYATELGADLAGKWVRLRLIVPQTVLSRAGTVTPDVEPVTIWTGYIAKRGETPANVAAEATPRGGDHYTCVGPERILEQCELFTSAWLIANVVQELDWMPGFNRRSAGGEVFGNRSATKLNGCYFFGGTGIWTRRQMLEHVIAYWVQVRSAADAPLWPIWHLSGQLEALESLTLPVECHERMTAKDLVDAIVSPRLGLDYIIVPTEDGFSIRVFTTMPADITAASYKLPGNRRRFELSLGGMTDVTAEFEDDEAAKYDQITVIGKRLVICLSAGQGAQNALLPAWSASQETAYNDGAGLGASADLHAAFRTSDHFRDVYQRYRLHSVTWQGGYAYPAVAHDGSIVVAGVGCQTWSRKTLDHIPLQDGYNYTTNPPTWNGVSGVLPEFRPPLVLAEHPTRGCLPVDLLAAADGGGATVAALKNEWGLNLRSNPNHLFARNHWGPSRADNFNPDVDGYDYEKLSATMAIESDHRVLMSWKLPEAQWSGLGLSRIIEVPEAELHLLAPQTIVGTTAAGARALSPNALVILRDDRDVLARVLAGAIGRYLMVRARASLVYDALLPAMAALGAILEWVAPGGVRREVNAPLTSIAWDFQRRQTRVSTGQARR